MGGEASSLTTSREMEEEDGRDGTGRGTGSRRANGPNSSYEFVFPLAKRPGGGRNWGWKWNHSPGI